MYLDDLFLLLQFLVHVKQLILRFICQIILLAGIAQ